jgi:pimeloyl-ACP methyl ester carboxylesterase
MLHLALVLVVALAACGGKKQPASYSDVDRGSPAFYDNESKPRSFIVKVHGEGRPVIFIPGLGCPGEMFDATVDHLTGVQAHVLTLAGFAGTKPIKPPLAATVRKELVRYIHSHHLVRPIVIGHSMGGFIAYWLAASAPDLLGGVIVVDAGPALGDNDVETANTLRNMWAQAGDDELPQQVRNAYSGMTTDPKHIEPYLDAIAKSDRQTMGDAIYEMVTTSVSDKVDRITAPLLLVLADGGYQQMYKQQVAAVPHHEVVVLAHTRHFVFFDDPIGWYKAIDKFLADHP